MQTNALKSMRSRREGSINVGSPKRKCKQKDPSRVASSFSLKRDFSNIKLTICNKYIRHKHMLILKTMIMVIY